MMAEEDVIPMQELRPSISRKKTAEILTKALNIPVADVETAVDVEMILPKIKNHGLKLDAIFLAAIADIIYLEMPEININWIDGDEPKILRHDELNFGLALESKNGLVVATIKNVEDKNLWQLNDEIKELSLRATKGMLTLGHFEPKPNIVFNNVGIYPNVIRGHSLFQPWNTLMISVFRITEVPVVWKGIVVPRPTMNVVLHFDHRPIDGKSASRFINSLKEKIENPWF